LRFVDSRITESLKLPLRADFVGPPAPDRIYFHVPFAIQSSITQEELSGLKALAETRSIDFFRRVIIDGDVTGLTVNQLLVVRAIHTAAQEKHRPIAFSMRDNFTLQLHLDYRMLPTVKRKGKPDADSEALELRYGEAYLARDDGNVLYHRFLAISGVKPHAPRILLPISLTTRMAKRLTGKEKNWSSFILELCQHDNG
jgi:hypothetical protein